MQEGENENPIVNLINSMAKDLPEIAAAQEISAVASASLIAPFEIAAAVTPSISMLSVGDQTVPMTTMSAVVNLDEILPGEKDESEDDNDDEAKENYEGFNGTTGRTVTLQMLMSANVLQPGKGAMTIEYLGQKFVGDLLADGKIKSQETETIFVTPSAWAMHCKRIINPEKKSGCGWASVKYKGKKLDAYKNSWLRKCALQKESTPDDYEPDADKKSDSPLPTVKRIVFPHNAISNRNLMHDANMLIEAVPFSTVGRLQPFLLTINSSALLLADFHCHLTMREVCGYLGGNWDVNTHTLSITKAYPCRNTRFDRTKSAEVEREIQKLMMRDQLILVGWYHSHPKFQAEPTLRDCDSQLDYQIRMRGPTEVTYTPCVSVILSPYYDDNPTLESVVKSIWVVPPNENKQSLEYGRPMLMQYSVLPDKEIPEEVRTEIQTCVDYYSQFRNEIVKFSSVFNADDISYIEKLKNTLYPKFPVKQNDKALWNWICAVLDCEQEDDFIPPKTIKIIDNADEAPPPPLPLLKPEQLLLASHDLTLIADNAAPLLKDEPLRVGLLNTGEEETAEQEQQRTQAEQKAASELKVLSLQEQLCLPSGLNMNPVRMLSPLATPNPSAVAAVAAPSINPPPPALNAAALAPAAVSLLPPLPPLPPALPLATGLLQAQQQLPLSLSASVVSPRDSPITITSNAASPAAAAAKFELPVRASPSPAKSDASSSRTRNSPAPSPGKFSMSGDMARNSPSITPTLSVGKYDAASLSLLPPAVSANMGSAGGGVLPSANDLMAASLAQLAGQLPPNFLQTDIAALFQQTTAQPQQQHQRKDYGSSSLNQLAAAAAKVGGGGQKQSAAASNSMSSALGGLAELTDPNVAAAVAAYSNSFNMPRGSVQDTLAQQQPATSSSSLGNHNNNNSGGKSKSERSSKSSSSSSSSSSASSSSNSYKTKLMKELDDLKNDPLKMSELMRSPEYAALLLQQAEALGATTLGSLGFGGAADFSYLTGGMGLGGSGMGPSAVSSSSGGGGGGGGKSSKNSSSAAAAAASAAALTADYNNLIQASKLLGYDSYMQQAKSNDLNAFLQQQMGAAAAAAAAAAVTNPSTSSSGSSSKKQQQQQQQQQQQAVAAAAAVAAAQQQQQQQQAHPDYTTLLQTYSKLFDPGNQFGSAMMAPGKGSGSGGSSAHHELSALLAAGVGGGVGLGGMSSLGTGGSSKQKQKDMQAQAQAAAVAAQQQTDMLNQLLQSEKQHSDLNALLYHQNKAAADLNALFATPSSATGGGSNKSGGGGNSGGSASSSSTGGGGAPSPLTDPAAYYNALAQEKMQDYAAFFQQHHGKYGIPDPLSKSTLAANNLFMSPSALLKIQQESLSAMMMKPPKSTTATTSSSSSSTAAGGAVNLGSSGSGRGGGNRESSASPASLERLTPTKSAAAGSAAAAAAAAAKYNFSAVDLAISSVPSNTPSPAPSDGSSGSSHRRPSNATPPVDLSRLYGELAAPNLGTKKRMEFSSIADLAAPPAKIQKTSGDDVLNLSNE